MPLFTTLLQRFAATCDPSGGSFFGLPTWYKYLEGETDAFGRCVPQIGDPANVWLIVLAVIDALLRLAAIIAVGFVLYGGIQFIVSQGEPERTNQARNTIINALIGLVITMSAAGIVSFIGVSIN